MSRLENAPDAIRDNCGYRWESTNINWRLTCGYWTPSAWITSR